MPIHRAAFTPALLRAPLRVLLPALLAASLWAAPGLAAALPAAAPLPPARPDAEAPPEAPAQGAGGPRAGTAAPIPPDPRHEACLDALVRTGAGFEERPPVAEGACGAARPLLVTRLPDGLAVAPPATLTCPAALALARWSLASVGPEAERQFGQPALRIRIGTSYQCRGQNHRPDAKLSEHAFANGVDVAGFELGGRRSVTVAAAPEASAEARFLDAVRASACRHFRTVLGPGSDASHGDHLHLDMRERRNGFALCQ